jgi:hypothetical protein
VVPNSVQSLGGVTVHVSLNESVTVACAMVATVPARTGTLKVNQSSEWLTIRSISSSVASDERSGACPPIDTALSLISHHRGSGAPG